MKKNYEKFISKIGIVFFMALVFGVFGGSNVLADNVLHDDTYIVGTSNLNNTAQNSAKVGIALTLPEIGWRRYDDTNSNINYFGSTWFEDQGKYNTDGSLDFFYNRTVHYSKTLNTDIIKFNFTGDKVRIITLGYSNSHNLNVKIKIDNNIYSYSEGSNNSLNVLPETLVFDRAGLENKEHSVQIYTDIGDNLFFSLDAVDIDSTGELKPYDENPSIVVSKILLNKTIDDLQVGQTDNLRASFIPDNATNKNVNWSSSNPTIATVDSTGKVTALSVGTTTILASTMDGSNLSASCIVNVTAQVPPVVQGIVLNIEPEKTKISLNETVSANLVIDNIKDIAAEDVRIKYDSSKLQFISADEVDGIKLVKNDAQTGELRFIVASKGLANVVEAKKILLKLNFKGIAVGDALVDVTKGRVSDGITMEKDLTDAECGQATITIIDNETLGDVNNSGEFTLLDLAIDGRHFGEAPSTLPQYNTDIVVNNAIDNDDLTKIGEVMIVNPNYRFL